MTRTRFDSRPTTRPQLETLEDRLVPSTVAGSYADGTWRYDTTAGWTHISDMMADELGVDDAGDVYGSFSNGVWRWSTSTASWMKLSNLNTSAFQVTTAGVLYGDFGTNGVWRWAPTSGWMKLSNLVVDDFVVSGSDAFFGRFDTAGAEGTWRWTPAAGWSLLTGNRPNTLKTDDAGEFVGVFKYYIAAGQVGTWRWNPTTGWARLSTSAASLSVSANGAIYESRGGGNVWRVAPGAASFTQIGFNQAPNDVAMSAVPDGNLFELQFNNSGTPLATGWYWSPSLLGLGFVKIINNADNIFPPVIGKDGDLFFDANTAGTGYWSLQVAYHALAGNTQNPGFLVSQR
jgi:hypothetical protein